MLVNELPTEIKYTLLFDQNVEFPTGDPKLLNQTSATNQAEVIESD